LAWRGSLSDPNRPFSGTHWLRSVKKLKVGEALLLVEQGLVDFVAGFEAGVSGFLPCVALHSTHTHDRIIFRGAFDYRDHIWRDWVSVDWGRHGQLPNKMWGFDDLCGLPADLPCNQQLNFGGVANLSPSIYAIVESTELSPSLHGDVNCDIFMRLHTEVGAKTDGFVSKLKFYLADVEAFVDPCIVIPNLGGETNSYFWVQNRRKRAKSFANWLRAPHHMDHMDWLNDNDDTDTDEE